LTDILKEELEANEYSLIIVGYDERVVKKILSKCDIPVMAIHSHEVAKEEKKMSSSNPGINNNYRLNETQEQGINEIQIPVSDKSNAELSTNTNNNQNTEVRINVRHRKHKSSPKHHEKRKKRNPENISKESFGEVHEGMKLKEKREQIETLKRILTSPDEEIHKSESDQQHMDQSPQIKLSTTSSTKKSKKHNALGSQQINESPYLNSSDEDERKSSSSSLDSDDELDEVVISYNTEQ
jgi:hypothetical protein